MHLKNILPVTSGCTNWGDKMRDLIYDVNGQQMLESENCDFKNIAKGSNNYLRLRFNCNHEWLNMAKAITLRNSYGKAFNLPVKAGCCVLPYDAVSGLYFTFMLRGKNKDGEVITTNQVLVVQC